MISKEAQKKIDKVIDRYGKAIIVRYSGASFITQEELSDLLSQGILTPEMLEGATVEDAYLIGRLRSEMTDEERNSQLDPADFHRQNFGKVATMSEKHVKVIESIKANSHNALEGLVSTIRNKVNGAFLRSNFERSQEYLGEEIKNVLEEAYIENKSLGKLVQDLKKQMKDFSSKYQTIVTTEMTKAINAGAADLILEKEKTKSTSDVYVYFLTVHDNRLCPVCSSLYLTSAGTPRVFTMSEVIANGSNYGKKRPQWKASLQGVHPNCRCLVRKISDGWGFKAGSDQMVYIGDGHLEYEKQAK